MSGDREFFQVSVPLKRDLMVLPPLATSSASVGCGTSSHCSVARPVGNMRNYRLVVHEIRAENKNLRLLP